MSPLECQACPLQVDSPFCTSLPYNSFFRFNDEPQLDNSLPPYVKAQDKDPYNGPSRLRFARSHIPIDPEITVFSRNGKMNYKEVKYKTDYQPEEDMPGIQGETSHVMEPVKEAEKEPIPKPRTKKRSKSRQKNVIEPRRMSRRSRRKEKPPDSLRVNVMSTL